MSNLFDNSTYPTSIPTELVAGDRWAWKRTDLTEYGSGYTLSYELTAEGGGTPVTLTAAFSGSDYIIEVGAATTAAYPPGTYRWVALITRDSDSERYRIGYGTVIVRPDPATSTADPRSHAKKVLDAINAVLETRATQDQMAYTINGRTLERTPIKDLLRLRDDYAKAVRDEMIVERVAKGLGTGNQIKVRMR